MNDLDAIAQLVFFILIAAGWVLKAVVESRKAKQNRRVPQPPKVEGGGGRDAPGRVSRPRPVPAPVPPPAPRRARRSLGHLELNVDDRTHRGADGAFVPGRLLRSSAAAVAHGKQALQVRRTSVLARLTGGRDVAPGRDLTRAGVLWSEILGPCRALKGPHRSPAATRIRRP